MKQQAKRLAGNKYFVRVAQVFVIAVIGGGIFLAVSRAGSLIASFNAADGTLSGNACTTTDTGAASGRAVAFGCGGDSTSLLPFAQRASTIQTFLAPGVKPPTNQWFSNLAFKQPSDPVFAYPLALQSTSSGFGVSYPQVVSTTNTITGGYNQDLLADMGAVQTRVLSYDDLSVTLEARNGSASVAEYRLTQGSPIVYVRLKAGNHISWTSPNPLTLSTKNGYYTADTGGKNYLLSYGSGVNASASGATLTLNATADADVAVGVLPSGSPDVAAFASEMQDPITGTQVGLGVSGSTAVTTFNLQTKSGNGSPLALVPAQQTGTAPGGVIGTYATVLGTQKLYNISSYTFSTPATAPSTELDVSKLSASEKSEVIATLTTDINNLSTNGFTAADTYFGGKQLARAANLMHLAQQLGQTTLAQTAYDQINAQMSLWLNPDSSDGRATKYFYYDTNLKGMVGVQPSFGSDTEFNDHHFHYGYFLYAAGYMAEHDPSFATAHKDVVNTLVRDIADGTRNDPYFPYLRPFDKYAGHSWASGTSPFADGNNNESSSEAVNAWYGLYLWGKYSGNSTLETRGRWLFARESNAALTYWTNFDRSQPQFANYTHSVVSMVWGGKMDYSTWFSASAYAKLGIQILPVTPATEYLGADTARVQTNLNGLNDGSAPMFLDVMAMYRSFSDPSGAVTAANALQDNQIDDGNSRTWLKAWVYTHN
ncbi:hypothetical protein EYC59_06235 [Candidatus Saccharibacteria bacterium]|nr:MAG: hypothetical protein EYC59_06235 [Candidatus Saccharibacteria bacterium]